MLTIEKCLEQIKDKNRFKLVVVIVQRTYELSSGARPRVALHEHEKNIITALREASEGLLNEEELMEGSLKRYYKSIYGSPVDEGSDAESDDDEMAEEFDLGAEEFEEDKKHSFHSYEPGSEQEE